MRCYIAYAIQFIIHTIQSVRLRKSINILVQKLCRGYGTSIFLICFFCKLLTKRNINLIGDGKSYFFCR